MLIGIDQCFPIHGKTQSKQHYFRSDRRDRAGPGQVSGARRSTAVSAWSDLFRFTHQESQSGRSAFDRTVLITKAESLHLTVQRQLERITTGDRVISAKVLGSSYYRTATAALDVLMTRNSQPPHLVADMSVG